MLTDKEQSFLVPTAEKIPGDPEPQVKVENDFNRMDISFNEMSPAITSNNVFSTISEITE